MLALSIGMRVSPEPLSERALVEIKGFPAVPTALPPRNACLNDVGKPARQQAGRRTIERGDDRTPR